MTKLAPPPPTNWPLVAFNSWHWHHSTGGKTVEDYKRTFHVQEERALQWHNTAWLTEFYLFAAKGKLTVVDGVIALKEPFEKVFNLNDPDDKRPMPASLMDEEFAAKIIATRSNLTEAEKELALGEFKLCCIRYMPNRLVDWYAFHLTESPLYPMPETLSEEEIEAHYHRLMTAPTTTAEGQLAIF